MPIDIKNPDKTLFDTQAEQLANEIFQARVFFKQNKKKDINTLTQIRRFYDELVMWNERIVQTEEAQKNDEFKKILPFVRMLNSKIAYAQGRTLVDHTFRDKMQDLIRQIDSPETLNRAKLFMEAMIGFYKQFDNQQPIKE